MSLASAFSFGEERSCLEFNSFAILFVNLLCPSVAMLQSQKKWALSSTASVPHIGQCGSTGEPSAWVSLRLCLASLRGNLFVTSRVANFFLASVHWVVAYVEPGLDSRRSSHSRFVACRRGRYRCLAIFLRVWPGFFSIRWPLQ